MVKILFLGMYMFFTIGAYAQEVPIVNYTITNTDQIALEVASDIEHYYILKIRHNASTEFEIATSMTLGETDSTVLSEPLEAYPLSQYQVLEYAIGTPFDTDGDGVNDITEYIDSPSQSPLNFAPSVDLENGLVTVYDLEDFRQLSVEGDDIPWAPFLNGREFVKFGIVDLQSDNPQVYFINTNTHERHFYFYNAVGIDYINGDVLNGEIIYHPLEVSDNGTLGVFSFSYSQGFGETFENIQKTHELLAANMPFVTNNLSYFITTNGEDNYLENAMLFEQSRVSVLFEADVYNDIDYLPVNPAEGYGLLRVMGLDETPSGRDVVLYQALPNNLPRVAGIITSFIQTPLSHVNLRAIQDNVPNCFIKEPLTLETIANLVDRYIHFKVTENEYIIEEASLSEVNAWHEAKRPEQEQKPPLNLSFTEILPLEEIDFEMSDGYGAKCTNIATMLTFGFPENTIPNGFGVPFYFYQEFMKYNDFFDRIELMMVNEDFKTNIDVRISMLKQLRRDIKDADMPSWMLDALQEMHDYFPEGTSVRVRSSTNNEDLPGFSGAGLYDSKTQHPEEGHISKSIKQVYASMWNFRAFDEREYYRINHFIASMGALCHPNYKDEKANGVGVTTDPIYHSQNNFYLNSQVGEDLITNPDAFSIPEEILLSKNPSLENNYTVIRHSSEVENGALVMNENYLNELRGYMNLIHDEFGKLYNALDDDSFAMDIEYKITAQNQLIVKQARPWSSFWTGLEQNQTSTETEVKYFPNPSNDEVYFICDCNVTTIRVVNLLGQELLEQSADFTDLNSEISIKSLPKGLYVVYGLNPNGSIYFSKKLLKN